MFIGRQKEKQQIQNILDQNSKNAILIYGKRRVGKSYLVTNILQSYSCKTIYYECINASLEENLTHFENRIKAVFNNRYLHFESFEDAFQFLDSTNEKIIIVLDEYSYLKTSREKKYVDSVFQRIIDQMKGNLHLIILGSYVSMMRELLEEENPLFGRFSLVIHLTAFNYFDASLFYHSKSIYEKPAFYAVFGGSPFVNFEIDQNKDLRSNIIGLILNPNSAIRSYLEHILLSELSKIGPANMILSALSNGKKRYSEIAAKVRSETPGALDKQLKNLILMDIISKNNPINKTDDRKKTFYSISDNLVRFYYSYIFSNRDIIRTIGETAFYDLMIQPTLETFISYRFEEIAREYFQIMVQDGKINNVYNIGTYWYDNPSERKNGEFDCVLKHRDSYSFYEVKYHKEPISRELCAKEESEIRHLAGSMNIEKIGFISISGYSFSSDKYDLIDGVKLYHF